MRKLIIFALCLLFLSGCGAGSVPIADSPDVTESIADTTPAATYETLPVVDAAISDVLLGVGYTVEHATEIQYILNTVGINSIEIYGMTGEAEVGLNAMSCFANGSDERSSRFTVTTDNGVVFYVGFLGEDLYDSERGGFLKKYTDVHIPETEVDSDTFATLQYMAEIEVESCLTYPSSADFQTFSWRVGRSDDNYKISGRVNAQNAFGMESEMYFSVWFTKQNDSFTLVGVEIDGQRVK